MSGKLEKPRRLGRGLSSLIGDPVKVDVAPINSEVSNYKQSAPPVSPSPSSPVGGGGEGLRMVPVSDVEPSPFQPRSVFDEKALEQLASSIRQSGLMQPVIVRAKEGGRYELVAGERRWRAAILAGLGRIPAIVRTLTDEESAQWALVENVQREDLNAVEKARSFAALAERFGLSHAQIAERVGVDRTTVTNLVRMLDLEPSILSMVSSGKLSGGHGRALLIMAPGPAREKLAARAAAEEWSVRRLERAAGGDEGALEPGGIGLRPGVGDGAEVSREMARTALEKQIGEQLGTRVRITTDRSGSRGRLSIDFYGLEHFDGLLARIGVRVK